jgi:hypothetical protein
MGNVLYYEDTVMNRKNMVPAVVWIWLECISPKGLCARSLVPSVVVLRSSEPLRCRLPPLEGINVVMLDPG